MAKPEIRPCPCMGKVAVIKQKRPKEPYTVVCIACGRLYSHERTEIKAIETWNAALEENRPPRYVLLTQGGGQL